MNRRARFTDRQGFTLIELLVVITLILLVSAVTLPTVISAYTHRQVCEAARILQAGLVGARDIAINNNAPAGIRLLPDPVFNGIDPTTNTLDPKRILASNRFIPIQLAPDYTDGLVNIVDPNNPSSMGALLAAYTAVGVDPTAYFTYPPQKGGGAYLAATNRMLYLVQSVYNLTTPTPTLNSPTSWYWNIRIGDKVQVNNSGIYCTVVGPMNTPNTDLFVNIGPPGSPPVLQYTLPVSGTPYYPEILFLVNGLDDNNDGYVDNGWDGIDNDGDGIVDQVTDTNTPPLSEWVETEHWQAALLSGNAINVPYSITRRPVVVSGARETPLPSDVVIDLTTWHANLPERSRLPVDPSSGSVDILLKPNGTVVPTTVYSSPTSFGMSSAFYHFWLAERGDVYPIPTDTNGNAVPLVSGYTFYLPMPLGSNIPPTTNAYDQLVASNPGLPYLKGEIRLLSLFSQTGQILVNDSPVFNVDPQGVNQPYVLPQQGARGGR